MKHSLPHTTLFGPFLDFCILQGCEYLSNLHLAGDAHYRSERVIHEELGTQVFSTMLSQLQESPYIALMADETTYCRNKGAYLVCKVIVPSATPQRCVRSIFLQVSEFRWQGRHHNYCYLGALDQSRSFHQQSNGFWL